MRIRTIKPEFFKDEQLAELTPWARLLFIGLWGLADRDGRLEDRPMRIKVEILPYDNLDVEALLNEIASHREKFIIRYETDGKKVIQIRTFTKHQRINGREADSPSVLPKHKITPEASGKHQGSDGEALKVDGEAPEDGKPPKPIENLNDSSPEAMGKHQGSDGEAMGHSGREGKGKEGEGGEGSGPTTTTSLMDQMKSKIRGCRPEYRNLRDDLIENTLKDVPPELWGNAVKDFTRDQERALMAENNPLKILSGYLYHASTKKDAPGKAVGLDPNKRIFKTEKQR